jgi:hypothetical protein
VRIALSKPGAVRSSRDVGVILERDRADLTRPHRRVSRPGGLHRRRGIRAYGVNTGVGALCDVVVDEPKQRQLSRNVVMSHAAGVGPPLAPRETRAIIAAAINNFALGYSGIRLRVVECLMQMLSQGCVPEVPASGSVGYLSAYGPHCVVLLGRGTPSCAASAVPAPRRCRALDVQPLVLEAKEGLEPGQRHALRDRAVRRRAVRAWSECWTGRTRSPR